MKSSMLVDFKILKRNSENEYVPMNNDEAQAVSVGGFSFDIGENSIPFDWDAFTGSEENGVFSFVTGRGFLFNDYEISDCYDEDYKDMEINKEDITAEFLSSVHHIEEFFVDFAYGDDSVGIGDYHDNAKSDAEFKLELINLSFEDIETGKVYDVNKEVLEAFNKGVYREYDKDLSSLNDKIAVAEDVKQNNSVFAPVNEREER